MQTGNGIGHEEKGKHLLEQQEAFLVVLSRVGEDQEYYAREYIKSKVWVVGKTDERKSVSSWRANKETP